MKTIAKATILLVGIALTSGVAEAHHCQFEAVAKHAESIRCDADELKSIVKSEFKRTDCYGKIRRKIAGLKLKAAKVRRRANTIQTAKWDREFAKIDEYICELNELLILTIESDEGYCRDLARCLPKVSFLLDNMAADLQCMRIALGCPLPEPAAIGTPRATRRLLLPTTPAPNFAPGQAPAIEYPAPEYMEPSGQPVPAPIPESVLPPTQNSRPNPPSTGNSILVPRTETKLELPRPNRVDPARSTLNQQPGTAFNPPVDSALKATRQSTETRQQQAQDSDSAKPKVKSEPRKSILDFFG